jgi:hypothetical protein
MTRRRTRALGATLLALAAAASTVGCGADVERSETTDGRRVDDGVRQVANGPLPDGNWALHIARRVQLRESPGGRVLGMIRTRTVFGAPVYLPVIERRDGWVRVRTSMRRARSGWVPADAGPVLRQPRSIVIDLSDRRMRIIHRGRVTHSYKVAIGSPAHPTPTGTFYVTDRLRTDDPFGTYGCCILPLNVRQPNVPQGWGGGDRIAIHGTTDTTVLGQAVTLGCIRASNRAMRRVMRAVRLGTPVTVRE